jgi:hypothetical protein
VKRTTLQIEPIRVEPQAPAEPEPCRRKPGPDDWRQDGHDEQDFEPDRRQAPNGEVALPVQFLFHPVHLVHPVKIRVFDAHPVNSEESSLIQVNPSKSGMKNLVRTSASPRLCGPLGTQDKNLFVFSAFFVVK